MLLWLAALCLAGCAGGPGVGRQSAIASALAAPDRPEADRALDPARRPAQLLAFSRVARGEKVMDVGAGGGYFTWLLSSMVGPRGQVVAQDAPVYVRNVAAQRERLLAARPNVQGSVVPFEDIDGEAGTFDLVTVVLMYHDIVRLGDRQKMNRQILRLLKPGGRVLVVDHAAPRGSGLRDTPTLHRIDPDQVRQDFEAAGLRLIATSSLLANPADDMTLPPFDPKFRWRTNQFVLLFDKPRRPL